MPVIGGHSTLQRVFFCNLIVKLPPNALVSFFIRLFEGYYQCNFLSSSCNQLLNLPNTWHTTQHWQSVGLVLIGQTGKKKHSVDCIHGGGMKIHLRLKGVNSIHCSGS
jgi:hypothetical protein